MAESADDKVVRPAHYGGKDNIYEVIKVIDAWGLQRSFNLANAVKYVARVSLSGKQGQSALVDLKKAKQYLEFEIARIEALDC